MPIDDCGGGGGINEGRTVLGPLDARRAGPSRLWWNALLAGGAVGTPCAVLVAPLLGAVGPLW